MFALLFQKNGFVFVNQIWHCRALNQYSVAHKIRFRLWTDKANLLETHFKALNQYSVAHKSRFRLLTDFKTNLLETHFKALNQYSVAQKIRFRLLTDFRANLLGTQIQGEFFWKVSRFTSLFWKNVCLFVDQILHFSVFC